MPVEQGKRIDAYAGSKLTPSNAGVAMALWSELDPVDESFFRTAAHRFVYPMELAASADEVWAAIAAPSPLPWCRALRGEYVSAQPLGVGAKRHVTVLKGLLGLREHFFIWDDTQRRHAFYAEQATNPVLRAFAEDYQVEPTANGSRFTWTFAMDPRPKLGGALKLAVPLNKLIFNSLINDTYRKFGRAD